MVDKIKKYISIKQRQFLFMSHGRWIYTAD